MDGARLVLPEVFAADQLIKFPVCHVLQLLEPDFVPNEHIPIWQYLYRRRAECRHAIRHYLWCGEEEL